MQATEIKAKVDKYAKWQEILGLPTTDATASINAAIEKLDKTQALWETVDRWQQLMDTYNTMPFTSLNKADIARDIEAIVSKTTALLASDPSNPVALHLMERVDQYKKVSNVWVRNVVEAGGGGGGGRGSGTATSSMT